MDAVIPANRYMMPAKCSGCGKRSGPRPLGITPLGWSREYVAWPGQGRYYCGECRPRKVYGGKGSRDA